MCVIISAVTVFTSSHLTVIADSDNPKGGGSDLKVERILVDRRENVLGIDMTTPEFSWTESSTSRGDLQSAYEFGVASTYSKAASGDYDVWYTGKVMSDSMRLRYGESETHTAKPLEARTRYYFSLKLYDQNGDASPLSDVYFFETGLMDGFGASNKWITHDTEEEDLAATYFRREFTLAKPRSEVDHARLYATSAGSHEMLLNGSRAGNDYMAPGKSVYSKILYYQTYDVTDKLLDGNNTVACRLGHGWYYGGMPGGTYSKRTGLKAKLIVTYKDGSEQTIDTDGSWYSSKNGSVTHNRYYDGETIDGRKRLDGFAENGYDTKKGDFKPVKATDTFAYDGGLITSNIIAEQMQPVRNTEIFHPVKARKVGDKKYIYYIEQNIAGTLRLTATADAGTEITIDYSEHDGDGEIEIGAYLNHNGTDRYIFRGDPEGETVEFSFALHGYQLFQISGLDHQLDFNDIDCLVLTNDLEYDSYFESSNSLLNRYAENVKWSLRGNFLSTLTDCPTREKNSWAGDAQIFAHAASYNANVYNAYRNFQEMIRMNQGAEGAIPEIVGGSGTTGVGGKAPAGWSDAVILIPWEMYYQYGDLSALEENYEAMKKWISYVENYCVDKETGIRINTSYADHLAWFNGNSEFCKYYEKGYNEQNFEYREVKYDEIGTSFTAYSCNVLSHIAKLLGHEDDSAYYKSLYESFKKVWRENYLKRDAFGEITIEPVSESETSYVTGIMFDLYNEDELTTAGIKLAERIHELGDIQTVGFIGINFFYQALAKTNQLDTAFKVFEQTKHPSLLASVTMGATTTWETYGNGGGSHNHYVLGAPGAWLYSDVLGITNGYKDENAGYRHFELNPNLGGTLTYAKGAYASESGKICSAMEYVGNGYRYSCTVPANTSATLSLPCSGDAIVKEGMSFANDADGVTYIGYENGRKYYELASGSYSFNVYDADFSVNLGDVDGDGTVSTADNLFLMRHVAGFRGYESLPNAAAADIDCDGAVGPADQIYLARALASWRGYELNNRLELEIADVTIAGSPDASGNYSGELILALRKNPGIAKLEFTLELPEGIVSENCVGGDIFDDTANLSSCKNTASPRICFDSAQNTSAVGTLICLKLKAPAYIASDGVVSASSIKAATAAGTKVIAKSNNGKIICGFDSPDAFLEASKLSSNADKRYFTSEMKRDNNFPYLRFAVSKDVASSDNVRIDMRFDADAFPSDFSAKNSRYLKLGYRSNIKNADSSFKFDILSPTGARLWGANCKLSEVAYDSDWHDMIIDLSALKLYGGDGSYSSDFDAVEWSDEWYKAFFEANLDGRLTGLVLRPYNSYNVTLFEGEYFDLSYAAFFSDRAAAEDFVYSPIETADKIKITLADISAGYTIADAENGYYDAALPITLSGNAELGAIDLKLKVSDGIETVGHSNGDIFPSRCGVSTEYSPSDYEIKYKANSYDRVNADGCLAVAALHIPETLPSGRYSAEIEIVSAYDREGKALMLDTKNARATLTLTSHAPAAVFDADNITGRVRSELEVKRVPSGKNPSYLRYFPSGTGVAGDGPRAIAEFDQTRFRTDFSAVQSRFIKLCFRSNITASKQLGVDVHTGSARLWGEHTMFAGMKYDGNWQSIIFDLKAMKLSAGEGTYITDGISAAEGSDEWYYEFYEKNLSSTLAGLTLKPYGYGGATLGADDYFDIMYVGFFNSLEDAEAYEYVYEFDPNVKFEVQNTEAGITVSPAAGGYYSARIPINLTRNPGTAKLTAAVTADTEVEIVGIDNGELFDHSEFSSALSLGRADISINASANCAETGILAYINVRLPESAANGRYGVSLEVTSVADILGDTLAPKVANGYIKLITPKPDALFTSKSLTNGASGVYAFKASDEHVRFSVTQNGSSNDSTRATVKFDESVFPEGFTLIESKYMKICYRSNIKGAAKTEINVFPEERGRLWGVGTIKDMTYNEEWQTVIYDLESTGFNGGEGYYLADGTDGKDFYELNFDGVMSQLLFRPHTPVGSDMSVGDYFDVKYIAFFTSEASAIAYLL